VHSVAESRDNTSIAALDDDPTDDEPPMPPEPEDWHLMEPPVSSDSSLFSPDEEMPIEEPPLDLEPEPQAQARPLLEKQFKAASAALQSVPVDVPLTDSIGPMPPLIISPHVFASPRSVEKGEAHMVTVILRATGEKERDIRRLKRVHGLLRSCPGNDHFCFYIFENGHRHFLDFPNDTTGVNSQLIDRLVELVGNENIQVETIKFQ
jgi:DNA polymerase-3 subunit alpha